MCNGSFVGYIIFILLQIIQVVFLPINGIIFTIPAIIIYGPTKSFLLCFVGIMLGSIAMFYIGKFGGCKILKWIVGDKAANKYIQSLAKGKYLLPIFINSLFKKSQIYNIYPFF